MGHRKAYFKKHQDSPAPLIAKVDRRVRFEEVDALDMVWHGRYPSYFEDGRIAFGDRYGLTYVSFIHHRVMAPIVQMHIDYASPLRFDQMITIETTLHWNEALRLDFSYTIRDQKGTVAASGYTVQVLTDQNGSVLFVPPDWIREFRDKWQSGHWIKT